MANRTTDTGDIRVTDTGDIRVTGEPAAVSFSGTGITVNDVTVLSDDSLEVDISIDLGATLSARNVAVTTAEGTSGNQTFTVTPSTDKFFAFFK